MKTYKVELLFTNLDNSLYTDDGAAMCIEIKSDTYSHAYLLGQRLCKLLEADQFNLEEV